MAKGRARDIAQRTARFVQRVQQLGLDRALEVFNITLAEAKSLLQSGGFSPQQTEIFLETGDLQAAVADPDFGKLDFENIPGPVQNVLNRFGGISDAGTELVRQPTRTEGARAAEDVGTDILRGRTPEQAARQDIREELFRTRGRTENTGILGQTGRNLLATGGRIGAPGLVEGEQEALDIIRNRGATADTRKLISTGLKLVRQGGFTPELRRLLDEGLAQIQRAGELTPELRRTFDAASEIVDAGGRGGALLPMDEVVQAAREETALAQEQTFQRAVRLARQRGAGGGALFSGAAARPLAEIADQSAIAQASAARGARERQQALQLQQLGQAQRTQLGAAAAGAQLEAQRTASANALLGDVARAGTQGLQAGASLAASGVNAAARNLATGFGALGDINRQFTQRTALGGDLAARAQELETQRLGLGAGISQDLTQDQLNAASILTGLEQQAQAGTRTGIEAGLGGARGAGDLLFNQQQLELGRQTTQTGQQSQLLQLQANIAQAAQSNNLEVFAQLVASQGQLLGLSGQALADFTRSRIAAAGFQAEPGTISSIIQATIPGLARAGAEFLLP